MARRVISRPGLALTVLLLLSAARPAPAQETGAPAPAAAAPGTTVSASWLADLPTGDNLFAALQGMQPDVVADEFSGGGLSAGQSIRIGALGSAFTQTAFRLDGIDITDPDGSGTPLFFPDLMFWQQVGVATDPRAVDVNAAGPVVSLETRLPGSHWRGSLGSSFTPPAFVEESSSSAAPPIARFDSWSHADAIVGGPLGHSRFRLIAGSDLTRASQFERTATVAQPARVGSGFAQLVFAATPRDRWRTFVLEQQVRYPLANGTVSRPLTASADDRSVALQSIWEHGVPGGVGWRGWVSYARRRRHADTGATDPFTIDRITNGPVPDLVDAGAGTDHRWSIGGAMTPAARVIGGVRHAWTAGAEVGGAGMRPAAPFTGLVGELVAGQPARVWQYSAPDLTSDRHETTVAAYVDDRMTWDSRLTVEAGLRYDGVSASAAGAATGVQWHTWLPRASVRWALPLPLGLALFTNYARSAYRLPLQLLAWGDPAAPVADVFRWDAPAGTTAVSAAALGPLVQRIGPGTGGNPAFSRIDPALRRPIVDAVTVGIDSNPARGIHVRFAGVARRERQLMGVVDTGVSASDYAIIQIPDPGLDLMNRIPILLPVANRLPSSFGADRYLLTNPAGDTATFVGLEISGDFALGRLQAFAGATAGRTLGLASSEGFYAAENTQGLAGDLFIDPNAAVNAKGRLYDDRGYTIKVAGVYRFPHEIHLGVIARYRDGQMFARLVPVAGLNQGVETVRAFANGGTRFTYTATVDVRLQKRVALGGRRFDVLLDVYNLSNRAAQVEEYVLGGPGFRSTTAVQPPLAARLGVRFAF